jgi:hypothetical protein
MDLQPAHERKRALRLARLAAQKAASEEPLA